MPEDKRCEELSDFLEDLSEADLTFVMWVLSERYSSKLKKEVESRKPETKEDMFAIRCEETIISGLSLLHELLGYEW
jgi:hypothetical protein